ncbi:hypothetical protein [Bacillus mycoides]|uniref:hypothetical protein n=1 Tax=Bacillus mycoides TaxID=1405 RepID=UPI001365D75E
MPLGIYIPLSNKYNLCTRTENTALIKRGRVPIVDEQFIKHFPQYKEGSGAKTSR